MPMNLANYFDYNATSPLLPAARAALVEALDGGFGNPSSLHWAGRASRKIVDEARAELALLAGVDPSAVTFVGGATEALAQVLHSNHAARVIASSLEHPALGSAARVFGGREVVSVPVRLRSPPEGAVDEASLEDALREAAVGGREAVLAVMAAHNVTGLVLPRVRASTVMPDGAAHVGRVLVDAAQYAGRLCLKSLVAAGTAGAPDYVVLAAHKLGGPKGIGAILTKPGLGLEPIFPGGGQEGGRRGGTEAVPLIAAFGAAARYWREEGEGERARLAGLRDRFEAHLMNARQDLAFVGRLGERLPQTSALIVPAHLDGETVVRAMHRAGFAVSAGSACASGSALPSPGLVALGLSPNEAIRVVRISLGFFSDEAGTDALASALIASFGDRA